MLYPLQPTSMRMTEHYGGIIPTDTDTTGSVAGTSSQPTQVNDDNREKRQRTKWALEMNIDLYAAIYK